MDKNALLYELNLFVQVNDIMYIRGEDNYPKLLEILKIEYPEIGDIESLANELIINYQ
jgi:hypothetical protein